MSTKLTLNIRIIIISVVTLLMAVHLAWDYFHGGVPIHHFFQSKNLPSISNWWGILVLPLVTCFLLGRIEKRTKNKKTANEVCNTIYRFISAMLFGITLSVLFTKNADLINYLMVGVFILSFFIPLYFSEYILGFVIGTTYTFGAIIPIIFVALLVVVFALTYKLRQAITVSKRTKLR